MVGVTTAREPSENVETRGEREAKPIEAGLERYTENTFF
jgi:hypothetical protein